METTYQILNQKENLETFLRNINSDLFRSIYSSDSSLIQDLYNYLPKKVFLDLLDIHPLFKFDILNFLNIDSFKEEEIFDLLLNGLDKQRLTDLPKVKSKVVSKPKVVKKSSYDVVSINKPIASSYYFYQKEIEPEKGKKIPIEILEEVEILPEYNQILDIIDNSILSISNKSSLVKSYNNVLEELLEVRDYGENLIGQSLPSIEVEKLKSDDKKDIIKVLDYQKLAIASLVNNIFQMIEYPQTRDFRPKWAKYYQDLKNKL